MQKINSINFKRLEPKRLYQHVVTQIKEKIVEGEFKVGDRLPTEKVIMGKLGVSKSSLREGFRVLEAEGLIVSRQGEGRFVREASRESLFKATGMIGAFEFSQILDLLEAREAVECKIASLAAKRARPAEINELRQILESMSLITKESYQNLESKLFHLDSRFHQTLASASHNAVFMNWVSLSLEISQEIRKKTLLIEDRQRTLIKELTGIADAVERHDARAAAALMKRHLLGVRKQIKEFEKISSGVHQETNDLMRKDLIPLDKEV